MGQGMLDREDDVGVEEGPDGRDVLLPACQGPADDADEHVQPEHREDDDPGVLKDTRRNRVARIPARCSTLLPLISDL